MKSFITALIAIGIIATIFFFLGKGCSKSQGILDNSREIELVTEIDKLKSQLVISNAERDSLLKIPQKIKTQIIYRDAQIDSAIAKDSTNALVQYRQSLQENNYLPDGTEALTYREIGIGSKLMAKVPKLELQIKGYDEIILKDNEIISNLNFQIGANEDLREMQRLAILNCEKQLEKEKAWYNSNYLWLGLGVVGTTAIIFLTGLAK